MSNYDRLTDIRNNEGASLPVEKQKYVRYFMHYSNVQVKLTSLELGNCPVLFYTEGAQRFGVRCSFEASRRSGNKILFYQ